LGWILRGIGELGAQAGEGHEIALDWKLKQQKAQLEQARAQMEQALLPLQMEEMRARIRKLGQPEQRFLTTASGGTDVVDIDPASGVGKPRELLPGNPKSLKEQLENEADPEKRKTLSARLKEETEATSHRTPLQDAQDDLNRALASQDPVAIQAARDKLKTFNEASTAGKPGAPTYWKMRMAALQPGPEGDAARAALAEDEKMQEARLAARGEAFGKGRMWTMRTYTNGQGQDEDMTGWEYERRKATGEQLTPTGRLSGNTVTAYQRFRMESVPALQGVEKDLGAFDNAGDRAIFAKIMKSAGTPDHGQEFPWMQNILRQALAEGLSEQGRDLTINLNRLAETMGTLRASLALPSTEQSMLLTLGLLPGPATPDARYARSQLANLKSIIDQASNVPIMQNLMPQTPKNGPPPGANIIPLDKFLSQ
jgi:hypothetical protein